MQDIQKLMAYAGTGVFVFVGVVLLIIIIHDVSKKPALLKQMRETTGKVMATGKRATETGSGPNRTTGVVDYAEIEYVIEDGSTYIFEHTYGLIEGSFKKGDVVPVCYLPDDPGEVMVNTFSAIWLTNIAMFIFAIIFTGAGVIVYIVMTPK